MVTSCSARYMLWGSRFGRAPQATGMAAHSLSARSHTFTISMQSNCGVQRMSRLIRLTFVALLTISASRASANIPSPTLSSVPDAITLSPGTRFSANPIGGYTVHIEGALGPVSGAFVEVEVSPDADAILSWCIGNTKPSPGYPTQVHPLLTGFTDANGNLSFQYFGGGCLSPSDFSGATFVAQVRADGIVIDEPFMNSPDAVDSMGKKATDDSQRRCDLVSLVSTAQVSLADAVFHSRPIKLGLREACTKFTPPFNGTVSVADATFLTPYIKLGRKCVCQ
jgi:hypothetical protein